MESASVLVVRACTDGVIGKQDMPFKELGIVSLRTQRISSIFYPSMQRMGASISAGDAEQLRAFGPKGAA